MSDLPESSLSTDRLDDGSQTMGSFFPSTAPPGVFRDISSVGNYRAYSQYAKTAPLCLSRNESEVGIERIVHTLLTCMMACMLWKHGLKSCTSVWVPEAQILMRSQSDLFAELER